MTSLLESDSPLGSVSFRCLMPLSAALLVSAFVVEALEAVSNRPRSYSLGLPGMRSLWFMLVPGHFELRAAVFQGDSLHCGHLHPHPSPADL